MQIKSKHSREFRLDAVYKSFDCDSISELARELGVRPANLIYWRKAYFERISELFTEKRQTNRNNLKRSKEKAERLSKENINLRNANKKLSEELAVFKAFYESSDQPKKQRVEFVIENEGRFPIRLMARIFNLDRRTHQIWTERERQAAERRAFLSDAIKKAFDESSGTYGRARLKVALANEGIETSTTTIGKLMREMGISGKKVKKARRPSHEGTRYPVVPNLINRRYKASRINEVWVSDISFVYTKSGYLHLTIIMDLWSRRIVGWSTCKVCSAENSSVAAWKHALESREISKPLIFHSDRGVQYTCKVFANLLEQTPLITRSMGTPSSKFDNHVAEAFFSQIKGEWLNKHDFETLEAANNSIKEYIDDWYNPKRIHSANGWVSPDEYETKNEG